MVPSGAIRQTAHNIHLPATRLSYPHMSGHPLVKFCALSAIALTLAVFAQPASAAHCIYNKTRQQSITVSSDRSNLLLGAGAHFCCKPNDPLCGPAAPVWKIDAVIDKRPLWCGVADAAKKRLPITLPPNDSYLLVRDARATATPLAAAPTAPATPATPVAPASMAALPRAPIDVDVMTSDGRVVTTLTCQFSG